MTQLSNEYHNTIEEIKDKTPNWIRWLITLLCIIIVVIFLYMKGCNHIQQGQQVYGVDSVKIWKDKYHQEHAKVESFSTLNTKDFLAIQSKDSTILLLQGKVKEYKSKLDAGSAVIYVSNNTDIKGKFKTDTIYKHDTTHIDNNNLPSYGFTVNKGKWIFGSGESGPDSTNLDLTVHNEYSLVIGYEKKKWWKLYKTPFAEITNYNPYTDTKTLTSYQVQVPKQKRLGLGINIGYGLYADPVNLRFGSGFTAGIGLQFNVINIK